MALPSFLNRELVSHTRKVQALYKKMCRDVAYWEEDYFEVKFKRLQIRREFDKNKAIKDVRVARDLLTRTEEDFTENVMHPNHRYDFRPWHPFSKHGISFERELESPDYVMDFYHPLEKARYPFWFAKREQMKDEYLALWNKKYGGTPPASH